MDVLENSRCPSLVAFRRAGQPSLEVITILVLAD